jgi:hypothetical protein
MSLAADYRRDGYASHAPHDYRDIARVCGDDPFAESGIEDLARPFLRSPAAP